MTDAPKYMTVSAFLSAEGEKKGPIYTHQYLRDEHRDLQRAAHALCVSAPGEYHLVVCHDEDSTHWPEIMGLWALCKDYKEEEND